MKKLPVCKNKHYLGKDGPNYSVQFRGNGYPCVTCRQCNKDRAKARRLRLKAERV